MDKALPRTSPTPKLDFWTALQDRGYTLETLYADLEHDARTQGSWLLEDFEAIVRSTVTMPSLCRLPETVCRHHRLLCESLEPQDYIINFNWDSLMADALLHYSYFWFPATGFGVRCHPWMRPCQKAYNVSSLVTLLHVHGSVVLFELETSKPDEVGTALFLVPKQWSVLSAMMDIEKRLDAQTSHPDPAVRSQPVIEKDYQQKIERGYLWLDGRWFRPIFVPPSKYKSQYDHWYVRAMKRAVHSRLPDTQRLVIAGYSFPDADLPHLQDIFVPGICDPGVEVVVVNPSNADSAFQQRVQQVFSRAGKFNFSTSDFQKFCNELRGAEPATPRG
jgi:hypothetical protein